jgi:hypothetical protein
VHTFLPQSFSIVSYSLVGLISTASSIVHRMDIITGRFARGISRAAIQSTPRHCVADYRSLQIINNPCVSVCVLLYIHMFSPLFFFFSSFSFSI